VLSIERKRWSGASIDSVFAASGGKQRPSAKRDTAPFFQSTLTAAQIGNFANAFQKAFPRFRPKVDEVKCREAARCPTAQLPLRPKK